MMDISDVIHLAWEMIQTLAVIYAIRKSEGVDALMYHVNGTLEKVKKKLG